MSFLPFGGMRSHTQRKKNRSALSKWVHVTSMVSVAASLDYKIINSSGLGHFFLFPRVGVKQAQTSILWELCRLRLSI